MPLYDQGQAEKASEITYEKFFNENNDNEGEIPNKLRFKSHFPRTKQQEEDYQQQMLAVTVVRRLLGAQSLRPIARPKDIRREFVSCLPTCV